jgi:FRG domain
VREIRLSSFDQFLVEYKTHFPEKTPEHTYFSDIIFRGHQKASFTLASTLERYTGMENTPIRDYVHVMLKCNPEFASYTDRRFEIDDQEVVGATSWNEISNLEGFMAFAIHLRHASFPSPLIDWTRSPYVAAYFAFSNAQAQDEVAIFAFLEFAGKGKHWSPSEPHIKSVGQYVRTSERHHIQQAEYTVCLAKQDAIEVFSKYDHALSQSSEDQDILIKFIIPATERSSVIRQLNLMNINAYTLFRSEDGLAAFLASKYLG